MHHGLAPHLSSLFSSTEVDFQHIENNNLCQDFNGNKFQLLHKSKVTNALDDRTIYSRKLNTLFVGGIYEKRMKCFLAVGGIRLAVTTQS